MKVKISSLVQNYNIYPREKTNEYNVIRIRNAIEAGAELPPVIADKKTRMIIDGFHRVAAAQLIHGPEAEIKIEYRDYKSLSEMFLTAVRLNTAQGKPLSAEDVKRVREVAKDLKVRPVYLANALSMTADRIKNLNMSRIDNGIITQDPVKQRSKSISENLVKEPAPKKNNNNKCHIFYVHQVINMIESDTIDVENEKLIYSLKRLNILLSAILNNKSGEKHGKAH